VTRRNATNADADADADAGRTEGCLILNSYSQLMDGSSVCGACGFGVHSHRLYFRRLSFSSHLPRLYWRHPPFRRDHLCGGTSSSTPSLASAKPRVDSRFSNYKPGCLFRYKQTGRFWYFLSVQHVCFRVRSKSGQVGDDVPRRWGFMVVSNNPGAICCRSRELQGGTGLRFGSGGFCVFQVPGEKEAKDSRSIFTERKKGGNK